MVDQGIDKKIADYIRTNFQLIFENEKIEKITIIGMTPGAYNLNYHVLVGDKKYIFRINIEQQSGLSKQADYEYTLLKYLEPYKIAPKAYYLDSSRAFFEFDILIEECLEGKWITLDDTDVPEIAKLLASLHSIEPLRERLITWSDPLIDTFTLAERDLQEYCSKRSAEKKTIDAVQNILEKIKPIVFEKRELFKPDSINHTDVAIDNIIKTSQGVKLIDWEKPRYDDCSYDICCFLAEPAQLWCVPQTISNRAKELFLSTYIRESGKDEKSFLEKVAIRQPLVSLHWVLWGMNRVCDLMDETTALELREVHYQRLERWKRVANPDLIHKIKEVVCQLAS